MPEAKNKKREYFYHQKRNSPGLKEYLGGNEEALPRSRGIDGKGFSPQSPSFVARCYYEKEKDLVRLADYLGHSSLETTRRYTMTGSLEACMAQLELGLAVEKGKKWEEMKKSGSEGRET